VLKCDAPNCFKDIGLRKIGGAGEGTRTPDPIITNDVLYQLSYTGTARSIATPKSGVQLKGRRTGLAEASAGCATSSDAARKRRVLHIPVPSSGAGTGATCTAPGS
jgi:hypothetical protein